MTLADFRATDQFGASRPRMEATQRMVCQATGFLYDV